MHENSVVMLTGKKKISYVPQEGHSEHRFIGQQTRNSVFDGASSILLAEFSY